MEIVGGLVGGADWGSNGASAAGQMRAELRALSGASASLDRARALERAPHTVRGAEQSGHSPPPSQWSTWNAFHRDTHEALRLSGLVAFPSARHTYWSSALASSASAKAERPPSHTEPPKGGRKFIRHVETSEGAAENGLDEPVGVAAGSTASPNGVEQLRGQLSSLREQLELELGRLEARTSSGKQEQQEEKERQEQKEKQDQKESLKQKQASDSSSEANGRKVALGSPCTKARDCQRAIANSHCHIESFSCACLPQHVQLNSTVCLPTTLLGFPCQIDAQCQFRVANSFCEQTSQKCACQPAFVPHRKDKCLSASQINDFCLSDAQCQLNDKHSHCKWRIPKVYGNCKCPLNYKLVTSGGSSKTASLDKNATTEATSKRLRCAPRLGDTCLTDEECLLATGNSSCQEPAGLDWQSAGQGLAVGGWQSSRAGPKRCLCAAGFAATPTGLECAPLQVAAQVELVGHSEASQSAEGQPLFGQADSARHHYELLAPVPSTTTSSSSLSTAATPTSESSGSGAGTELGAGEEGGSRGAANSSVSVATLPSSWSSASSLGKPCRTSAECRARDPHSHCLGGVCECVRPTRACSSRSTGCPADTFQCRNGQCISWYFVCDSLNNCDDASDELECLRGACPAAAFQCRSDGVCVSRGKLCNGRADCADGSDEWQCGRNSSASSLWIGDQGGKTGEQEKDSSSSGRPATPPSSPAAKECHPQAFACLDGTCLPNYVFCNAVLDCPDGSDELEQVCDRWASSRRPDVQRAPLGQPARAAVSTAPPPHGSTQSSSAATRGQNPAQRDSGARRATSGAPESPLVKTDRAAIERLLASLGPSLGKRRLLGGERVASGEQAAPARRRARVQRSLGPEEAPAFEAGECPRWAFTCANGKCRSSAILCSGVDGCGDNSDEHRCEVCQCAAPSPSLGQGATSGPASAPLATSSPPAH